MFLSLGPLTLAGAAVHDAPGAGYVVLLSIHPSQTRMREACVKQAAQAYQVSHH